MTTSKLDKILAQSYQERESGYRHKALKMYPHFCGRCSREFSGKGLSELTVHHRDHDNEHQRQVDMHYQKEERAGQKGPQQTFKGLAGLADLLNK